MDTVAVSACPPCCAGPLAAARLPIAAPSANLFSRPSPTRAAHVLADLDGRIDIVLDAGPVDIGVESTVVDLTTVPPTVLRPGAIGIEQLRDILPDVQLRTKAVTSNDTPMPSPGLLSQHYAPRTPMTLYPRTPSAGPESFVAHVREVLATGKRVGVLATTETQARSGRCRSSSPSSDRKLRPKPSRPVCMRHFGNWMPRKLTSSWRTTFQLMLDSGVRCAIAFAAHRPQVGRVLLDPPDMRAAESSDSVGRSIILLPGPEGPAYELVGSGHTACDSCGMRKTHYCDSHAVAHRARQAGRICADDLARVEPVSGHAPRPERPAQPRHLSSQGVPGAGRTLHGDARKSFERDVQRIHAC